MSRQRPRRLVLSNPKHTSTLSFDSDPKGSDHMSIAFANGKGRPVTLQLGPQHAADLVKTIIGWLPHMKQTRHGY